MDAELRAKEKDPAREKEAADNAARHANTHMEHFDVLGRSVLAVGHNRSVDSDADEVFIILNLTWI